MHARIHCYQSGRLPLDEIYRSGRHMVAKLGQVPGFVSFVMLDLGQGGFASVCVCAEVAALEEADGVAESWLAEHLGSSDARASETTSGEVVLQRGL